MKLLAVLALSLFTQVAFTAETTDYPQKPDFMLTPGDLCSEPESYRYAEKIPYCDRKVNAKIKNEVIRNYDQLLHFKITSMPRSDFKIDHYIPLCMGGSNSPLNLWPQHKSLYSVTDNLEKVLCEKMAEGLMTQAEAVQHIRAAKNNLGQIKTIYKAINLQ